MKQGSQGRGLLGYLGVAMVGIERSDSQDPDGKNKDLREITGATPNLEDMEQEEESLEVTQTGVNGTLEEEELLESGTTGALQVEASK